MPKLKSITIAFFTIFTSLFFFTEIVNASISQSEVALGGIQPYATVEQVEKIYGAPTTKQKHFSGIVYNYGGTFKITFFPYKNLHEGQGPDILVAKDIITTANNSIAMPCGLCVGMTEENMISKLGTPDGRGAKSQYVYNSKQANGQCVQIVTKNGKIVSICATINM